MDENASDCGRPTHVTLYTLKCSYIRFHKARLKHYVLNDIQGVSILGGHNIGHSKKKKMYVYMCPIPYGFRGRAISLYNSKIVDKKEILRK
jgi:hypothetical protein